MKANEYFQNSGDFQPAKGSKGIVSEWLDFGEFQLRGTRCLVVDANFVPSADDGVLIDLPAGLYQLALKGIDFDGDKRVARLRVVRPQCNPSLGKQIGETWTDTALTGICDFDVFSKSWGDDDDASFEKIEEMLSTEEPLGTAVLDAATGAVMPFVDSGFGDGTFPIHELLKHGTRVGFEVEFIKDDEPYPFTPRKPGSIASQEEIPEVQTVDQLRATATKGDAEAQCELGRRCITGEGGIVKDYEQAIKWCTMAAESGHAGATYLLAHLYDNGLGVPPNPSEAVRLYEKAAAQNQSEALNELGIHYQNGRGVERDLAKAAAYYQKAMKEGSAIAMVNLGVMYQNGWGVPKNVVKALSLYHLTAGIDIAAGQFNLGLMYMNGCGIAKNEKQGAEWYRKAAEQGYPKAQCNYGNCLFNGIGVKKNEQRAVEWFRKAASAGHAASQNNLGYCYLTGAGVERDGAMAAQWYRQAIENGMIPAQKNLGRMLIRGDGVEKNIEEGLRLLRDASQKGCAAADCELGILFEKGIGVPQNRIEACRYYRRARAGGEPEADTRLSELMPLLTEEERGALDAS